MTDAAVLPWHEVGSRPVDGDRRRRRHASRSRRWSRWSPACRRGSPATRYVLTDAGDLPSVVRRRVDQTVVASQRVAAARQGRGAAGGAPDPRSGGAGVDRSCSTTTPTARTRRSARRPGRSWPRPWPRSSPELTSRSARGVAAHLALERGRRRRRRGPAPCRRGSAGAGRPWRAPRRAGSARTARGRRGRRARSRHRNRRGRTASPRGPPGQASGIGDHATCGVRRPRRRPGEPLDGARRRP